MKQTPLKRKTPLRAKSPMKSGGTLRAKAKRKRAQGKPDPRWRSSTYLAWVRSLPCCNCGAGECQAHHAISIGGLSGMGLTAPDQWAMPLCPTCHNTLHDTPDMWPSQWRWVAQTMALAVDKGLLVLAPKDTREAL